ncbi:MAG TPA: hypothetical protein VFU15_14200, partial [Bacteroidia bacterium]|nr:hypothetical protein [Bacteroidia bacterium]
MKLNLQNIALSAFAAALILSSCSNNGGDGKTGDTTPPETLSVTGVKIKGQSFLMPSPMIIASIIKKSGALYDKNMLNPTASLPNYGDATKAALNLGVYGADLGYITMYENTGDAMEYYKTVVQLG